MTTLKKALDTECVTTVIIINNKISPPLDDGIRNTLQFPLKFLLSLLQGIHKMEDEKRKLIFVVSYTYIYFGNLLSNSLHHL